MQTLVALRLATKGWNAAADALIDEGVASGEMMVHGEKDFRDSIYLWDRKLVTRVIFLLNAIKVGDRACKYTENLVVVDIPEGVEIISECAFFSLESLTTVSFPTTLKSIGKEAFCHCLSLDNVDLLHTNLQELGWRAFCECSELRSMTIPESLQTFGDDVIWDCSKLVRSSINVTTTMSTIYDEYDITSKVVAHIHLIQQPTLCHSRPSKKLQKKKSLFV